MGPLHGLMRTRAFEPDNVHVFCRQKVRLADAARSAGLRIPFSRAGAPSMDASSNSPYETVRGRSWVRHGSIGLLLPEGLGASYVPSRRLPILYVLTGKLRGVSPLELMMATGNGQKVAEMDPGVAQALRKLAKTLPKGFSVDEATLSHRAQEYQNARGASRTKKRYPLVGDLYDKLIDLSAHPEKHDKFVRKLRKEQTIEWGFDLSSLIAQFYLKRSEKKARIHAHTLCGAALKAIPRLCRLRVSRATEISAACKG